MNLYAESSSLLAWLLVEQEGSRIYPCLKSAEKIISSDLTLVECDRALLRAVALGRLSDTEFGDARHRISAAASRWTILRIGSDVVERARRPFPVEPIRALDAIHLASALVANSVTPGIEILSLDNRIRDAAHQLGFKLQPR